MRLIDADEFILSLNDYIDKPITAGLCATLIHLFPTAYDIDKVVEELEKEIKLYENSKSIMGGNDADIEYDGAMKGLGKAIEIVKQGDKGAE